MYRGIYRAYFLAVPALLSRNVRVRVSVKRDNKLQYIDNFNKKRKRFFSIGPQNIILLNRNIPGEDIQSDKR